MCEILLFNSWSHVSSTTVESTTMVLSSPQLVSCIVATESSGSERNRYCPIRYVFSLPRVVFLSTALASLLSPEVVQDIVKSLRQNESCWKAL